MQLMEKLVLPAGQFLHWLWSPVSNKNKKNIKTLTFRQHTHDANVPDHYVKTQNIFKSPWKWLESSYHRGAEHHMYRWQQQNQPTLHSSHSTEPTAGAHIGQIGVWDSKSFGTRVKIKI